MRTGIYEGINMPMVPGEHDGSAFNFHLTHLPFCERLRRQHGCERPRACVPSRVIDTDAFTIHKFSTEIGCAVGNNKTQERQPTPCRALLALPLHHRCRIQCCSNGIQQSMHEAKPSGTLLGVLPIGHTR
jgi:hypothetical protein